MTETVPRLVVRTYAPMRRRWLLAVLALLAAAIARALDEFRNKQTASVAEAPVDAPA